MLRAGEAQAEVAAASLSWEAVPGWGFQGVLEDVTVSQARAGSRMGHSRTGPSRHPGNYTRVKRSLFHEGADRVY